VAARMKNLSCVLVLLATPLLAVGTQSAAERQLETPFPRLGTETNGVRVSFAIAEKRVTVELAADSVKRSCTISADEAAAWVDSIARAVALSGSAAPADSSRFITPENAGPCASVALRLSNASLLTFGGQLRVAAELIRVSGLEAHAQMHSPAGELVDPSQIYFDFQVDTAVRPLERTHIEYPRALIDSAIEGEVVANFVVDSLGNVERGSFRVMRSSHPEFEIAVRAALSRMRYRPAQKSGRPVRQLVMQPFHFRLERER
jgi:TonB family protein